MLKHRIAFVGAGAIARAHAFALSALPYYYPGVPQLEPVVVASATPEHRQQFAARHNFLCASAPELVWGRHDLDTIFILGPNRVHFSHVLQALQMTAVKRIYVEKPVCVNPDEELVLLQLNKSLRPDCLIQVGFQFLQMAAVQHALNLWRAGFFGSPIHFHARYLHSDYLNLEYRKTRATRLTSAPEGGVIADLGSHLFSLLIAFLGNQLTVVAAQQSGTFRDVPAESDLCTTVLLSDGQSGAAGTVVASRVSMGAGDVLEVELRGTRGALRLSTERPDELQIFSGDNPGAWQSICCASDYGPLSQFPFHSAPAGWLRSLIHAHYLFFNGGCSETFKPDLTHALLVQRLIRSVVEQLSARVLRDAQ
jgi:predicted dehydrogenase